VEAKQWALHTALIIDLFEITAFINPPKDEHNAL
jgi:hypothetical protein